MMRVQFKLRHVALLVACTALPLLFGASVVRAQACQADADCGAGYRCLTNTGTICGGCSVPVPPSAADASVGDAGAPWPGYADAGCADAGCTTYEYHYCAPALCDSDADCPASMACHTETWQSCSGYECKPGFDCEGDAGFTCSEQTQRSCRERHELPCQTGPECGDGFDCNRDPYISCWGSGGVISDGDGGFTIIDGGSGCTTVTPDSGYCELLNLPCQSSAECPERMSCQTMLDYPPCFPGARDAGAVFVDAAVAAIDAAVVPVPGNADAGAVPYECPPPAQTQVCRPERWGGGGTGATGGGATIGGGGSYGDAGAILVDSGTSAPGSAGGSVGGTTGGGPGGAGSADAGSDPGEDDQGLHHGPWRSLLRRLFGKGGCSLGAESAEGNFAWLSLLCGLLVLRARRRR